MEALGMIANKGLITLTGKQYVVAACVMAIVRGDVSAVNAAPGAGPGPKE